MSKKVKNLITKELTDRFKELDGVGVINPRGINAIKTNQIRRRLHEKGLRMTVVKNTLAKRAVGEGSKIKGFDKLLDGPSAVIYGKRQHRRRRPLPAGREEDRREARAARHLLRRRSSTSATRASKQVSKLPTREEAIGTWSA